MSGTEVVVIDSGGANLASLGYALDRLDAQSVISSDPSVIARAERVILPGVGNAGAIMHRLVGLELLPVIRALRCPVLGICLGMQILFQHSAEGDTPTLGIIEGDIQAITSRPEVTVPHMGWNTLHIVQDDPLLQGFSEQAWFYFVHGYHARADAPSTLATVTHGGAMAAVVRQANFYGVQFHPERSARSGAQLLQNFLDLPCN